VLTEQVAGAAGTPAWRSANEVLFWTPEGATGGAQMMEPYVSERVGWGIRYHQALRFYPDSSVGCEYPVPIVS
jgi:hypothetical protein